VDRVGLEAGIPTRALIQLQVALDEILSNIIKYAWPEGGSHEFSVAIELRDGGVEITITDDGCPFNPFAQAAPKPTPAGRLRVALASIWWDSWSTISNMRASMTETGSRLRSDTTWTCRSSREKPMTNSALTVTESHSGNVCVVALAGRIDSSNANDFLARLNGLISSGEKSILVDFANVLFPAHTPERPVALLRATVQ